MTHRSYHRRVVTLGRVVTLSLLVLTATSVGMPRAEAAPAALPEAQQIIDRYIEATGGRQAYEKIRTRHATGTMEFTGMGIAGALSLWQSRPARMYMSVELAGLGKTESGSADEIVWERNAMTGPRILQGNERAAILRTAALDAELNWKNYYASARCTGIEDVDGRPAYAVIFTPAEGRPVTQYYDRESGLLTRTSMVVETQMGDVPTETYTSDYRSVDGVLLPHLSRTSVMTMNQVIRLDRVEHNVEVPDGRFAVPEEVRALLRD